MTRLRIGVLCFAATLAVTGSLLTASALTAPQQLAAAYDRILNAQFEEADAALQPCAPAPAVACRLLDATALWWSIQLDPENTALDPEFIAETDAIITAAEEWTEREPRRAEAWFYLGGAYGLRVQWRVLRGERLAAARDGKRIKEALERALELDPQMADARFGIGLYKYYADVAPALARFFRFLLLLPGGDREAGLRDMIGARDHGVLLRGEADYQLHWIYLWYEEQPRRAMALLRGLLKRYPQNPLFRRRIAEIEVEYFHDRGASLDAWLALMADARAGRVASAALALTVARLGAAEQLDARFETDRALELLTPIVQEQPQQPYGAVARATLLQADAYQRLGRRADAIRAYRAALAARPERDIWHIGDRARAGLGRSHDSKRAQAYARSLEGWRAFERGALAAAERALDRSIILAPDDPVTWYRRARVYQRRQQIDRALVAFGRVIGSRPVAPPVVLGPAYFHRGQILEARGERTAAAAAFHAAARVFGVDDDVRISAERALSRLHSPTAQR